MARRLLGSALAALLAACGGGTTAPTPGAVASVEVTPAADTLIALGQTQQLMAVAKDAGGNVVSGKTFSWSSSAPGVVSVDAASGVATGVANGAATITASVDGKSGQAAVAVLQQVATVTVSPDTASLAAVGTTKQFSAAAKDANGNAVTGVALIWLSSNHAVATIDTAGLATATGPGTVTITAAARGVPGTAHLAVTQTAAQLAFSVEPTSTVLDQAISPVVQVEIQDAAGVRVAGARTAVTLAIGNDPGNGGQLVGSLTANAVDGIASFSGLTISNWGQGYTLVATAGSLTQATSAAFDVTLGLVQLGVGPDARHTCGITGTGRAFCWGDNISGQLGDGTTSNRNVPVPVAGDLRFATIAVGGNHTCGITSGGAGYCWGDNANGQLGDGTTNSRTVPAAMFSAPTLAGVAAGGLHTCAVSSDSTTSCWGYNGAGQLGDNSTADASTWKLVTGGSPWWGVSAGGAHSCGISGAGTVYCWGYNATGELGNGTTANDSVPDAVNSFALVSAGQSHTCAIAAGGAAYCWGDNTYGQLGKGAASATPDSVPVAVSGGLTFATLSPGVTHTCGITTAGAAYCWGQNITGQLGDGTAPTEQDAPAAVSGGLTFTQIVAGQQHTCGMTAAGAVYCWGANNYGELGDGTQQVRQVPVRVKGT